jgi:cyclic-di-GMP-binding protein
MAGEGTFDVVSDFDRQELVNALDQVRREVTTRFDFKNAKVELELAKEEIILKADSEMHAHSIRDLLESKAAKRGLSLKIFDWGTIEPAGGNMVRQQIKLRRGLPIELAKKISQLIRDEFPKVKPSIQGDAVRVAAKSKDDLQRVIARLREEGEGYVVPIQFENYRS